MIKQETLDENIDSIMFTEKDMKRSALHKREYLDWMKKRNFTNVNKKYLYYPDEMRRNMEIKNVFINIDKDGSSYFHFSINITLGNLDMSEIYNMFRQYNFNIQKEDLEKLFLVVDEDKDSNYLLQKNKNLKDALNWKEFKKCALDEQANKVFTCMMRKLREIEEIKKDKKLDYIPMNFGNMISFLSYCSSRDDIYQEINQEDKPIIDKFTQIQNLFKLTDEYQQHQQQMSTNPQVQTLQTHDTHETIEKSPESLTKGKSDLDKFFQSLQKKPQKKSDPKIQPPKKYNFQPTSPKNEQAQISSKLFKSQDQNQQKQQQLKVLFRSKPNTKLRTTLPQNLKEIDQQINQGFNRKSDLFTSQELNQQVSRNEKIRVEKLKKLRKEVDNFIGVAKDKYNIEIDQYENSFLDRKANILASDLKQELLQFQPNFKHFSQYSSENNTPAMNKRKSKNQNQRSNYPKNPQIHLRNTSSVPNMLAKDLKYFRSINKHVLYNTMGHTFYTRYIEHPIYAQDLLGSNKFKETPSTRTHTNINTAFQSTQNSMNIKNTEFKQKELYQSQDGIVFSLRDKPFNSSHQSIAKRLYGTGFNHQDDNSSPLKAHKKSRSEVSSFYGKMNTNNDNQNLQ